MFVNVLNPCAMDHRIISACQFCVALQLLGSRDGNILCPISHPTRPERWDNWAWKIPNKQPTNSVPGLEIRNPFFDKEYDRREAAEWF